MSDLNFLMEQSKSLSQIIFIQQYVISNMLGQFPLKALLKIDINSRNYKYITHVMQSNKG